MFGLVQQGQSGERVEREYGLGRGASIW